MGTPKSDNVLIIGGLGFLGAHLALRLRQQGHTVTVLDNLRSHSPARPSLLDLNYHGIQIIEKDFTDPATLRPLLPAFRIIFALAGQVSHQCSMQQPLLDLDLNCRAILQLLELCRHVQMPPRIVFTSTRQVYGRQQKQPVTEEQPCTPVDINGISKLAAEHFLGLYSQHYGIPTVSLRFTNVYGPAMDLISPNRGVLNQIIGNVLRGQSVELYEGGRLRRDLLYIDDAVTALALAGTMNCAPGTALNVSGDSAFSLAHIVSILAELLPVSVSDHPFPAHLRTMDIGDFQGDSSRFRGLSGWSPRCTLPEGLAATVHFFTAHPQYFQRSWPVADADAVGGRLPP
jgi:UDP-glucose 4-epimerase